MLPPVRRPAPQGPGALLLQSCGPCRQAFTAADSAHPRAKRAAASAIALSESPPHNEQPEPLNVTAHLRRLRQARLDSQKVLEKLSRGESPISSFAGKLHSNSISVDRRVYEQVAHSRNRLSQQLSAKNQYIRALEEDLEARNECICESHAALKRVASGLENLRRMAESAKAAAEYGVSREEFVGKASSFVKRAQLLGQAVAEEVATMDKYSVRFVPVTWFGVASEVKLMGSFDSWSNGIVLSPEEINDQVFTRFEAGLPLTKGTYECKFLVDGAWRLAPDWPTVTKENGETNNVLEVF